MDLYLRLSRLPIIGLRSPLEIVFSLLLAFESRCSLELRHFVVIEWLLVSKTPASGVRSLDEICLVGLCGAERVAAEFCVGPASAFEACTVRPILCEIMKEAA